MIFDSHAHYDDKAFDGDRDALLSSFPQNGIEGVVNAGADRRSVWKTLELAEQYPFVYAAVGIHPEHGGDMREEDLEWLRGLLAGARVVAVGAGLLLGSDEEGASEKMVRRPACPGGGGKASGGGPFQRCGLGHAGADAVGIRETARLYPLLFLFQGNGGGVSEAGLQDRDRRRGHF